MEEKMTTPNCPVCKNNKNVKVVETIKNFMLTTSSESGNQWTYDTALMCKCTKCDCKFAHVVES